MNVLHLFAGAGGGILADVLAGNRVVGAVEIEEFPCKILEARQNDGTLPRFPIWNIDIRDFNLDLACVYAGRVDIVAAGFPCQPFSVAGQRKGEDDKRNMWPDTIETIRIIRPKYAFLENVPGLLAYPYTRRIFGDLAEAGYDAQWGCLSAEEVGAPHKRERLWIVAERTKV